MGFFGFFVLTRTDAPVGTLQGVPGTHAVVHEAIYGAGWRLAQIQDPPDVSTPGELAGRLASVTGRPALAINIYDSDVGIGEATTADGASVSFYMNEALATEMFGEYGFAPQQANVAALPELVRWARETGLATNVEALSAAMAGSPGPFGEGVHDFVLALGIPAP